LLLLLLLLLPLLLPLISAPSKLAEHRSRKGGKGAHVWAQRVWAPYPFRREAQGTGDGFTVPGECLAPWFW
jgi:hypothetical protein